MSADTGREAALKADARYAAQAARQNEGQEESESHQTERKKG
jgi:hypothetical protein